MIFDSLANFKNYTGVHRLFGVVWEYISTRDINRLSAGKYDIDKDIYAAVSEYSTKNIVRGKRKNSCSLNNFRYN